MSRKDWTAPAPLEVERPRLPWWVMLPRKVLYLLAPFIAVWLLARLTVGIARRVYRYPLALLVPAALVALGLRVGWWWALGAAVGVVAVAVVWWWRWPDTFRRGPAAQARSEVRRGWIYARVWRRTMVLTELTGRIGHTRYYPRIRRVRADPWRDRVLVQLVRGQSPTEYARRAEGLAHAFGASSCRVRVDRPRRVWLDFVHRDPLAPAVPVPALAAPGSAVELHKVVVGRLETGQPWRVPLQGGHVLVVGSTGAGKSSAVWALLWALAPAIRAGLVQVFGIDPKGGMELGRAPDVFTRLVYGNGPDAVELLEQVATMTRQRAERFRDLRVHDWSPGCGVPFVVLVVDELADIVAYQTDKTLKARAQMALQVLTSQGRAPGVCVVGAVQDPRKQVIDFRHLFPVKIAMRVDEAEQVDMVLGDGARERGATAHEIPESTPGVAWVKTDGHREPQRGRAFHLRPADLDALCAYIADGQTPYAMPTQLPYRSEEAA